MPNMATVATWPAGTAPSKRLTVGGFDVLKKPGTGANRFGAPLETISVTERGPGGVSSMTFSVEDINSEVTVRSGLLVEFWDVTNNRPIFLGYPDRWTLRPHEGGSGRWWDISCVGVEIWLDWAIIQADATIPVGINMSTAVQALVYQCSGVPGLNSSMVSATISSQASPISDDRFANLLINNAVTVTAGTTLREAIRQALAQTTFANQIGSLAGWTVDYYTGLRFYDNAIGVTWASDLTALTITDTAAGAVAASDLRATTDASGIIRNVFFRGDNSTHSALASDGTGLPGRTAYLTDATVVTAAGAAILARAYLSQNNLAGRGTFSIDPVNPNLGNIRAGSLLNLTDAQSGASTTGTVMEVTRAFYNATQERWDITYNGLAPSGAAQLKRLISQGARV